MNLQFASPYGCEICARPIGDDPTVRICEQCARLDRKPQFDRAAAALEFAGNARRIVLDYKFNGHFWMLDDFADWLEAAARSRFNVASIDAVLPMPATFRHRFDRGFNQCAYLARRVAQRLSRPCDENILRRSGSPRRQAGLSLDERWLNAVDTFAVQDRELVAGRTILVIDDVMTTGATLSECAKTLKSAGAWRVWALTLARAVL